MVVITKAKIIEFYENETKAKEPLLQWYHVAMLSDWQDFHSIKQTFIVWIALGMTGMFLM